MKTIHVTPISNCPYCHGDGYVYDTVDYGSTTSQMQSLCSCIEEQIPEDFDGDVEVISIPENYYSDDDWLEDAYDLKYESSDLDWEV